MLRALRAINEQVLFHFRLVLAITVQSIRTFMGVVVRVINMSSFFG